MATSRRDYYELLGVRATADEARDQEGVPRGSRASCTRTSPRSRTRRSASGGRRGVRGALEARDARALRPLRPRRAAQRRLHADDASTSAASPTCSRAFFGDDLFGVGGRAAQRARGADIAARGRDRARRGGAAASTREVPFQVAVAVRDVRAAAAPSRAPSPSPCATCGGARAPPAGHAHRARRVRPRADVPGAAAAPGRDRRASVPGLRRRGADASRSGRSTSRSRRASTTASGSGSRARATPARSAAGPATSTCSSASSPHPRFVREGNDLFSTVDLTMTEAALGATVTDPDARRRAGARVRGRARSPARCASSAARGMPVLQGFGRGDQRVLVNVAGAAAADRRAAPPARGVRADARPRRRTSADEGFFEKLKSAFR